jgi:Ca2+-binding RTX toxin-like protein
MKRTVFLLTLMGVVFLVTGTALAMTVRCSGGVCNGTEEVDRIFGSASDEIINAGDGNDEVFGRGRRDVIRGELGKDEIYGQRGNDGLKGSPGADKVFGGPGDDIVRGGTHTLVDDGRRDILDCGEGDMDTVYYTPDEDVIRHCENRNPPQ